MIFAAATLFAAGVCFFWPTMLGYVSERFPKTGALGLAVMGGAGMLSVSIVLPIMGLIYDQGIASRLTPGGHPTPSIEAAAGLQVLGKTAVLPCVLIVLFLVVFALQRRFRSGFVKN
jgi:MFS family permease